MQYYSATTPLPPYIPFPRFLLDIPLNDTDRLVYTFILSRMHLSQSNGWVDKEGRVFCRYTIQELMADIGKSKSTIVSAFSDLEKQGLLVRHREGSWNANKLYIRIPIINTTDDRQTKPPMARKSTPNNKNKKLNYTYQGDSL